MAIYFKAVIHFSLLHCTGFCYCLHMSSNWEAVSRYGIYLVLFISSCLVGPLKRKFSLFCIKKKLSFDCLKYSS